jgi:hypothetical protein
MYKQGPSTIPAGSALVHLPNHDAKYLAEW